MIALNWAIDLMRQQAMVAFVEHQNGRLREAAEAELKYLSFLSHDLRGHLGNVTLWLKVLQRKLGGSGQFAAELSALDTAQQAILDTTSGMGRLLEAERLRHQSGEADKAGPVGLRELLAGVADQFARQAEQKGITVALDVPAGATVTTDAELVKLALQNLIGNAVKYTDRGAVRVGAERAGAGRWTVCVSDDGPGIPADHVCRIFEAFQRGQMHGQQGVGLGLAIASRAAKLLNASLTVESHVGTGSTFRLAFPPEADR